MSSENTITVFIDVHDDIHEACKWWCGLFFEHFNLISQVVHEKTADAIIIGLDKKADIYVSPILSVLLSDKPPLFQDIMSKDNPIISFKGREDLLSTTFYLLNSLQEYHADTSLLDSLGRFDYNKSLQKHYECLEINLVAKYFNKIVDSSDKLKKCCTHDPLPSTYSISYDIDFVRPGFFKSLKQAIKRKSIRASIRTILHEFKIERTLTGIDDMIEFHKNDDTKKVDIYWLPIRGNQKINNQILSNSDYNINSKSIIDIIDELEQKGFNLGLHKSLNEDFSFEQEMSLLPFESLSNRNHFLKFRLPDHYDQIEKAGLHQDSSLGYSSHPGFRNSYDRAFRPFNLKENRPYNFVEKPIAIMDVALLRSKSPHSTLKRFLDLNNRNTHFHINWHNSTFWDHGTTALLNDLINQMNNI